MIFNFINLYIIFKILNFIKEENDLLYIFINYKKYYYIKIYKNMIFETNNKNDNLKKYLFSYEIKEFIDIILY